MLETQEDANGNRTELTYDEFSRLQRRVFPSKVTTGAVNIGDYNEYTYDDNHNVITERKRNRTVITNRYDNNNRLIKKSLSDNSFGQDVCYGYDLRGLTTFTRFTSESSTASNVCRSASLGRGITNVFDGFGNLTRATTTMGGVSRALEYRYDENSNRTRVTHPDNWFFAYGFDNLNRITSLREAASASPGASTNALLTVSYAPHGNRHRIARTGGATTTYNRDNALRLSSFVQDFSGTANDLTNFFVYNPASQITELRQSNTRYAYTGNQQRTGRYVANGLNQYTSIDGQSITYDANANLTRDGGFTYTYDMENRLVRVASSTVNATLTYDPLGRLFETVITPSGGSATRTQFLYDGDALVAEYNGTSTTPLHRYVHGDQVDEPWLQYNGHQVSAANRRQSPLFARGPPGEYYCP